MSSYRTSCSRVNKLVLVVLRKIKNRTSNLEVSCLTETWNFFPWERAVFVGFPLKISPWYINLSFRFIKSICSSTFPHFCQIHYHQCNHTEKDKPKYSCGLRRIESINHYTLYKSMRTLSSDSCACLEQRPLKDLIASMASSLLFSCFITTAMSFSALSTLSPAFIAFQKNTIAASGSFSTNWIQCKIAVDVS